MTIDTKRLRERLGGVQTPKMGGDNLAILLCSHFDNPDQDEDENGWTEDAIAGMYEVLDAIHKHYTDYIDALEARVEELKASLDGAKHENAAAWVLQESSERQRDEAIAALKVAREALGDLTSWFEGGPSSYGPWIIKAGEYGADDAVEAARQALAQIDAVKVDTEERG